jgi:hypothetical protein
MESHSRWVLSRKRKEGEMNEELIGNLAKNIENETNRSVVLKVMENVDKFKSVSDRAEKAEWIKKAIKKLEREVGKAKSVKIMENCGRDCCRDCRREHAKFKTLMSEYHSHLK